MFQFRQVLVRLRAGDSERDLARTGVMGRQKLAQIRAVAAERGWLYAVSELPNDATLAEAFGAQRRASRWTSAPARC